MHRAFRVTGPIVACLVVGAIAGYWFRGYQSSVISDEWYEISQIPLKGPNASLSYTTEALFNSDIPLPGIKSASAKVKFRPANDSSGNPVLGYVLTVDVASLDPHTIPERYKVTRTEKTKVGEFTAEPLKEVVYEMQISFTLVDKDGFRLAEVEGPKHNLYSGQSNVLQEVIQNPISLYVVRRTAQVLPKLSIDKCVSCD